MLFFVLSKEIRELKRGLQGDSWEFVLSRIEDIEKELDLMLTFLQVEEDKRFFLLDDMSRLYRSMKQ